MSQKSFWKGSRGEWYLLVQAILFLLLICGPHSFQWAARWRFPSTWIGSLAGGVLLAAGMLLAICGTLNLGSNFTPLPLPKENATLIVSGGYRFVRHPIYSGITIMAVGWGLWLHSWITIGYALLLLAFFDWKSRFEERMLMKRFPEYSDYRKLVRKLLPYIY